MDPNKGRYAQFTVGDVWRAVLGGAIFSLLSGSVSSQPAPQRQPVPGPPALEQASELMREVYGKELDKARTSEDKATLARMLLGQSTKTGDEPASHFVLLGMARDLAAEAGDAETALEAIDGIGKAYEIDLLAMKVETFGQVARTARTPAQNTTLVERALQVVDELVAEDRYDAATRLAKLALGAGRKAKDRTLIKEVIAHHRKIDQIAEAYAGLKEARATLEQNPIEPQANLAVGRFVCLVKGDWGRGVPMLALGADPALKALAQKELQGPASADEEAELADGWWDLAEAEKGPAGAQLKRRAYDWYREAETGLTGLALIRVEKRIQLLLGEMPELKVPVPVGELHCFEGQAAGAFSPDSRKILVGGRDGSFRLWDVEKQREIRRFGGHTRPVPVLCFSPDGRLIVSASGDGTVRVWDPASANELRSFPAQTPTARPMPVVSSDGKRLLCFTPQDTTVRLLDLESGDGLHQFGIRGRSRNVYVVAFSQDCRWALAGGFENTVRLWNVASGEAASFFDGQTHVYSGALSPDGRFALTGGADNLVRLWDITTRRELCRLQGHTNHVYSAALSPDGRRALSGSVDTTVRLWDLKTAHQIHCFQGHTKPVHAVSFSPDGRRALSIGQDRTLRLWGLSE